MAKMHKMDGKVELNCSAQKIFETLGAKLAQVPKLCPGVISQITVQQGDWHSVGSIHKWDLNMGGKSIYAVGRNDAIDEKTLKINRTIVEGELLKYYKSLKLHFQPIPKGNNGKSCVMIFGLEYEKMDEDAPDPTEFFNFVHDVFVKLGHQLSVVN
ncbi:MLP-like protein 31 [Silene latifolia]|uniref:MLP-like protein 31 n=1 Tax=Silene latifolia TaxID=37657 RepID=UPI003D78B0AE